MGDPQKPQVPFGELFDDEDVQQHYEGLAATLKAAKKRKLASCDDDDDDFANLCQDTRRYLLNYPKDCCHTSRV